MQVIIGGIAEYVSVCCFCGCALKTEEVAARLIGELQDFNQRGPPQPAAVVFCADCLIKLETYANDTVQKAWFRMQALDHQ